MGDSMEVRYQRAEQLLSWNLRPYLINTTLTPNWLDKNRFWFRRELTGGCEFVLVDTTNEQEKQQQPLFDHARLADELSALLDKNISRHRLPVQSLQWDDNGGMQFIVDEKTIYCDCHDYHCQLLDPRSLCLDAEIGIDSPDGCWRVTLREDNLFLQDLSCVVGERALTRDGEPFNSYCVYHNFPDFLTDLPERPAISWSQNSRYVVIQQVDQRQVGEMTLVQSVPLDGSHRPVSHHYRMATPGDPHLAMARLIVIDITTGASLLIDRPAVPASSVGPLDSGLVWWGEDHRLYFIETTRDKRSLAFICFDPVTGGSRVLVEEHNDTFLSPTPFFYTCPPLAKVLPDSNEFIWYSQCNGWGHLYLYDLMTGERKNPITTGEYAVTWLHHVDTEGRCLYFAAGGKEAECNPYDQKLYRINFDGSALCLLTPEAGYHDVPSPIAALPVEPDPM